MVKVFDGIFGARHHTLLVRWPDKSGRSMEDSIINGDRIDRVAGTLELSSALVRELRRHADKVEAVRDAESSYRDAVLAQSLRNAGKTRGASRKRIDAAFDALVDAVVELQASQNEILYLAESEGLAFSSVGALDPAFRSADCHYAGYLAARTYSQVREAVGPEPPAPASRNCTKAQVARAWAMDIAERALARC